MWHILNTKLIHWLNSYSFLSIFSISSIFFLYFIKHPSMIRNPDDGSLKPKFLDFLVYQFLSLSLSIYIYIYIYYIYLRTFKTHSVKWSRSHHD